MRKNERYDDFAEMMDRIHEEKKEALKNFRKEDFQKKLYQRIDSEFQKPFFSFLWQRRTAYAAAAVVVLVLLGWLGFRIFLPSPFEKDARAIAKIFRQALDLESIVPRRVEKESISKPGQAKIDELEWTIKRVLYAARREKILDKEIPQIFQRVLQNTTSEKPTVRKGLAILEKEK